VSRQVVSRRVVSRQVASRRVVSRRVLSGKYFQTLRRIAVHVNYHKDSDAQRETKEGLMQIFL